jgi:hypothetical protein
MYGVEEVIKECPGNGGHGKLKGKGIDHPLNDAEQGIAAFADLWRSMKLSAAKNQRSKPKVG